MEDGEGCWEELRWDDGEMVERSSMDIPVSGSSGTIHSVDLARITLDDILPLTALTSRNTSATLIRTE